MTPRWTPSPLGPQDDFLAEKFLLRNLDQISLGLIRLRRAIDFFWKYPNSSSIIANDSILNRFNSIRDQHFRSVILNSDYPVGYCVPISQMVYEFIISADNLSDFNELMPVREYTKAGGSLDIIWGICNRKYFQTAMQWGPFYVDVANDTVNPLKTCVEIHRFNDPNCPFTFVNDTKTFLSVLTSYHHVRLFKNTVFKTLSSHFPVLTISETNTLQIVTDSVLLKLISLDPGWKQEFELLDSVPNNLQKWIASQNVLRSFTDATVQDVSSKTFTELKLLAVALNHELQRHEIPSSDHTSVTDQVDCCS